MRKKIVFSMRGDELPPVTSERIDDTRNPFEPDLTEQAARGVGTIQIFVEVAGKWLEVLYLTLPEEPAK